MKKNEIKKQNDKQNNTNKEILQSIKNLALVFFFSVGKNINNKKNKRYY